MTKKVWKTVFIILGICALAVVAALLFLQYEMKYKRTETAKYVSPDRQYILIMEQIGEPAWPFGSVNGEFKLEKNGEVICRKKFSVADDGAGLAHNEPVVSWEDTCVRARVSGSEQEDMMYTLYYDGTSSSAKAELWYEEDEVVQHIRENYGKDVKCLEIDAVGYLFQASVTLPREGTFSFYGEEKDGKVEDNYLNAYFKYVGEWAAENHWPQVEWLEEGVGAAKKYSPCFSEYISTDRELRSFCEFVCDFVERCMAVDPFEECPEYFQEFQMTVSGMQVTFIPSVSVEEYERAAFYNELYELLEGRILEANAEKVAGTQESGADGGGQGSAEDAGGEGLHGAETSGNDLDSLEQSVIDYYLSTEPECSFQMGSVKYSLVPVDRALGSSYYVLIGTVDDGKTCVFVNRDPYNGSGGGAKWISFINEQLGFTCLTRSGGSYGTLYRTEDGGKSFAEVLYPSAKAVLSDGTYYNPFVMPEKVYQEGGILYMEVGQGPDGDYYGEAGYCHGLYRSLDEGLTWEFVEEIKAD